MRDVYETKGARELNALLEVETLASGTKIRVVRAKAPEAKSERDPRAMNHMDPSTKLVHAMLEEWGRETRRGADNGLPATTLLGRVIKQGPSAGQAGRPVSNLSEQSARVDACVSRLWKHAQSCILRYYTRWEPPEVMARQEKMSLSKFKETLRRARWLIGSWLDVK